MLFKARQPALVVSTRTPVRKAPDRAGSFGRGREDIGQLLTGSGALCPPIQARGGH